MQSKRIDNELSVDPEAGSNEESPAVDGDWGGGCRSGYRDREGIPAMVPQSVGQTAAQAKQQGEMRKLTGMPQILISSLELILATDQRRV